MPTTLDQQPLPHADDERSGLSPGLLPGIDTAHPFSDAVASRGSSTDARRASAITSSLDTDQRIDIGSYITPAVAAFLTLASVGAVIVGAAGWADASPFPMIAAGVFVVFAGLFARVQFGGGKYTPLVGALLLPVLALAATAAPHLDDGVGDRSYQPTSFDDVDAEYQFGIGNLDIDLRDVEFPPGEHVIQIEHGIGAASVHLPADVSYSATGEVSIGKLDLLGQSDDGVNTTIVAATDDGSSATIVVEFDTSIGYGSVERD